jgi:hypothetical protein
VPRPAAALIDIALLTGPFRERPFRITGRSAGRSYLGHNGVAAGFSAPWSQATSGAQGQATSA